MKPDLLEVVTCPNCGSRLLGREVFRASHAGDPLDGVVWCTSCRRWYPLENGLLELLIEPLAYSADRERFQQRHKGRLTALGLHGRQSAGGGSERAAEAHHQQQHFDWYANNAKQTYAEYERLPFWQAVDAITFARWKRQIRPGTRVLDVGCAQGRSTFRLADQPIDIIAFDISKALVSQAIDRSQPGARVTFFVGDATALPFVDESFDYVLTYGVLHHLPDPPHVCREIARVLKPRGIFFASENNRSALRGGFELLQRLWPAWYEEAGEYAQISCAQLNSWLTDVGLAPSLRTSVFVPPHALNHVPQSLGERVLGWTDRAANAIPGLRHNGGLVIVEAVKEPVTA